MADNPMKEMRHLWTVRSHLEDPEFPYMAAYDLSTKRIHYYTSKGVLNGVDEQLENLTNKYMFDEDFEED